MSMNIKVSSLSTTRVELKNQEAERCSQDPPFAQVTMILTTENRFSTDDFDNFLVPTNLPVF